MNHDSEAGAQTIPATVPPSTIGQRSQGAPVDTLERPASNLSATRIVVLTCLVLLPILAVWLFWQARVAFFLLFAGILFAAILDSAVRGLTGHTPLKRHHAVWIVIATVLALIAAFVGFGGTYLFSQLDELQQLVAKEADDVAAFVSTFRDGQAEEADTAFGVMRQFSTMVFGESEGGPAAAVSSVLSYLANIAIIFFIGVFLVIEPDLYKRGMAKLFPGHVSGEVETALADAGETLRNWLLGKLGSMAMIFVFTWVGLMLVGYPSAFALGLLAGLLAFIPNIGPILTYIPIALVGFSAGSTTTLIYGLAVYAAAQTIESYVFTPLIQKRMVSLPPALILFAQVLGGILFGLWGVALATPLTAIIRLWIGRYVAGEERS